jgi:hypothetical protein
LFLSLQAEKVAQSQQLDELVLPMDLVAEIHVAIPADGGNALGFD